VLPILANDHENKLKEIQNKIKHVQLEIAYYRSKKLFKKEVENTLQAMDLKYKKLKDIDLDLTLLIDKIIDGKESKYSPTWFKL
jgi:hypothetical protein